MTQAKQMASTLKKDDLTPQERLAISRRAIVRNMTIGEKERHEDDVEARAIGDARVDGERGGNWALAKRALKSWWYHHPANLAIDVARPIIGQYAKEHPAKLIAIAFAAGAAAVVLKPWRLISIGSIALAAFKSSDVTNIVMSMLSHSSQQSQNLTENSHNE